MATLEIPFVKGLAVNSTTVDYDDRLPVNMLSVPKQVVGSSSGYMRSFPGIVQKAQISGIARGVSANQAFDKVFRIQGINLVDETGKIYGQVGGAGNCSMPYSRNTQAVVANGKLQFWDGETLTELQNWADGEYISATVNSVFTPKYEGSEYIEIPPFQNVNTINITATVFLSDVTTKQFILGSQQSGAGYSGVYVEAGNFYVIEDNLDTAELIGAAVVGTNSINHNTSKQFTYPIEVIGGVIESGVFQNGMSGNIYDLVITDQGVPSNSRSYSCRINGKDEDTPPTQKYVTNSLDSPTEISSGGAITVTGGSLGFPVNSTAVVDGTLLTIGDFYYIEATTVTEGSNPNGFAEFSGIEATARIDGQGTVMDVFKATSQDDLRMFTENSETNFYGIAVSEVTSGILRGFADDDWTFLENEDAGDGSPATEFDIGEVIDAARNKGRYVWIKRRTDENSPDVFGITDLLNEQRPDYTAPFYSAESSLDENVGISDWRGYVVVFGRTSTEYFSLTGSTDPVYRVNQNLTIQAGIVGTHAKCKYLDTFAIVGGPENKPPSVYLLGNGSYTEIGTKRIQDILQSYSAAALEEIYLEPLKFESHELLLVHLPNHVLVYDHSSSGSGQYSWSIIKTDIAGDAPYRGIHHVYFNGNFTVGDKLSNKIGTLSNSVSTHFGEKVENILYTPLVKGTYGRAYDLELDTIPGASTSEYKIAISMTEDGLTYSPDYWLTMSKPNEYKNRVIARRLGYIDNIVGLRLRWITDKPSIISSVKVRVE